MIFLIPDDPVLFGVIGPFKKMRCFGTGATSSLALWIAPPMVHLAKSVVMLMLLFSMGARHAGHIKVMAMMYENWIYVVVVNKSSGRFYISE